MNGKEKREKESCPFPLPSCNAREILAGRIPDAIKNRVEAIRAKGEKGIVWIFGGGGAGGFQSTCGVVAAANLLGIDPNEADAHIGTSAGSIIAALLASASLTDAQAFYNAMLDGVVSMNGIGESWELITERAIKFLSLWKMNMKKYHDQKFAHLTAPQTRPTLSLISTTLMQWGKPITQAYFDNSQWTSAEGQIDIETLMNCSNISCSIPPLHSLQTERNGFLHHVRHADGGFHNVVKKTPLYELDVANVLFPDALKICVIPMPPAALSKAGIYTFEQNSYIMPYPNTMIIVPNDPPQGHWLNGIVKFDGQNNFFAGQNVIRNHGHMILKELSARGCLPNYVRRTWPVANIM